jgi:hypothetical protein
MRIRASAYISARKSEHQYQKEEFSYAYIYALASAAGYSFQRATTPLDQVGVDVTITAVPETPESRRLTLLDLQVKCTSRNVLLTDDEIRYPLPVKNYEELRYEEHSVPRILGCSCSSR